MPVVRMALNSKYCGHCTGGGGALYFFCVGLVMLVTGLQIAFLWDNKQTVLKRVIHTAYGVLPTSNPSRCTMLQKGVFYADTDELGCFDRKSRSGCASPESFSIAIYPKSKTNTERRSPNASMWWLRVKKGIKSSRYFVEDSQTACVLVPSFDHTLAAASRIDIMPYQIAKQLRQLPHWGQQHPGGRNHLLFNKHDDGGPVLDTGYAMVAKVGFSRKYYRPYFDISVPPPTSWDVDRGDLKMKVALMRGNKTGWAAWGLAERARLQQESNYQFTKPKYLLTFRGRYTSRLRHAIRAFLNEPDMALMRGSRDRHGTRDGESDQFSELLLETQFAFIPRGAGLYTYRLAEAIAAGAIPVIIADGYVLPFQEILDWRSFAVVVPEAHVLQLPSLLRSISEEDIRAMRCRLFSIWIDYFGSIEKQVHLTIEQVRWNLFGFAAAASGESLNMTSHIGDDILSNPFMSAYVRARKPSIRRLCARLAAFHGQP